MSKVLTAALLLVLAACEAGQDPAPHEENGVATASSVDVAPAPAPAEMKPAPAAARLVEEDGELLDFSYGWPAQAAALPELDAMLEADLEKQRDEALAMAREDKESRPATAPFAGHYLQKIWTAYGETPRLLSIAAQIATFNGGAHGNTSFESILWDRAASGPIRPADLFTDPAAAFAALNAPFCDALDQERVERREAPLPLEGEDWLIGCPPLTEQVLVPVDKDEDNRFERLRVLIPPYVAGPYVEGKYEVDVPVTGELRALIKPEFREAFGSRS